MTDEPEALSLLDAPVAPVTFTEPKVVGAEPEVIPGVVAGALKRVLTVVDQGDGTSHTVLTHVDDAGTEHPAV